jgi:hypothetical protein
MEKIMRNALAIIAALMIIGTGSADAQQQEAILQKIEVPNAGFDLILATAKPGSSLLYLRDQPDANVIYLGTDLVYGYSDIKPEMSELLDLATLMRPACSVQASPADKQSRTPVVVYIVPKRAAPVASTMR